MSLPGGQLWAAILAIAVLTYLSRALPLAIRSLQSLGQDDGLGRFLQVLGSALLAALAAVTLVPGIVDAVVSAQTSIYLVSVVVTALAALKWREAGLAMIAGIATFLVGLGFT